MRTQPAPPTAPCVLGGGGRAGGTRGLTGVRFPRKSLKQRQRMAYRQGQGAPLVSALLLPTWPPHQEPF